MTFSYFHSAVTSVIILNYLVQVYIFALMIQASVLFSYTLQCPLEYRTPKFHHYLYFPHPIQLIII